VNGANVASLTNKRAQSCLLDDRKTIEWIGQCRLPDERGPKVSA
jgi:hypothetical protein